MARLTEYLHPHEFARRLESEDMSRQRNIHIVQGTRGLIEIDHVYDRELRPGVYPFGGALPRSRTEVVVIRAGKFRLPFHLDYIPCGGPQSANVSFSLVLECRAGCEALFLTNTMAGRKRFTDTDIKTMIVEGLRNFCCRTLQAYVLQSQPCDQSFEGEMRQLVEEYSSKSLSSNGISVVGVENLKLEPCQDPLSCLKLLQRRRFRSAQK